MDELGPLIFGSYEECLMYYARQRLLASQAHCRLCGTTMDLKKRPSVKDQFSWRLLLLLLLLLIMDTHNTKIQKYA